jgi:hypothetical protein
MITLLGVNSDCKTRGPNDALSFFFSDGDAPTIRLFDVNMTAIHGVIMILSAQFSPMVMRR